MGRVRRVYTKEFMQRAVALARLPEASVTRTAKSLGVPQKTLEGWVKGRGVKQAVGAGSPPSAQSGGGDDPIALRARLEEAEARIRRLEMEKEILKKATAFFASQNP